MQNFLRNVKLLWQNNLKLKLISLFLFFVSCRSSKRYAYENLITREVQFEKPEDDDDDDDEDDVELVPATDKSKGMSYLVAHAKVWLSKLTLYFQEKLKMVFNRLYPPNLRKRSNSLLYLHLLQNYQYSPNHRNRKIKSRTWNFRKRKSRKAFPL